MTSLQPYMDWEQNGPSYLTDNDVEEDAANAAEEEIWHVAVAWDDIKMMTLEQLDDAFRLDIIAADTPVWKEGMDDWQPLSVVAGMEDEAGADEDAPVPDETDVVEDEDDEATVMRPFPFPAPSRAAAPRAPNPPPRPPTRAPNPPPRSAARVPSAPPAPRGPSAQPVTLRNASARGPAPVQAAPSAPVKTQPRMKATQPPPAAHVFAPPPSPAAHVFAPPARSAPPPAMQAFARPARSAPPHANVFAPPARSAPPPAMQAFARSAPPAPYPAAQQFPQAYPSAQPFHAQAFGSSRPTSPASLAPNADLGFARSMAPARPFAYPRRRRGSGAVYFFLPLALFGGLFAAYRNDLLLEAARALHQEHHYLQVERALVGVPGFGTPRSVAASRLSTDANSEPTTDSTTKTTRDEAPSRSLPSLDTHGAPSQDDRTTPSSAVAKDLEPKAAPKTTETKSVEATRQFVESKPAPEPRRAAAPERPEPREKPAPAHVAAAPAASHAAPPRAEPPPPAPRHEVASSTKHESHDVKAAKVVLSETNDEAPASTGRHSKHAAAIASATTKAAASFGSLAAHADEDEAPAPKAPKAAPKPKAEPKPAAAPPPAPVAVSSGNSALDDAIRAAASKKTNKKKAPGADSDPLNGSLD